MAKLLHCIFAQLLFALVLLSVGLFGQETTAGLQGTVKDQSGAVVSQAVVAVTGSTLVGDKQTRTDSAGYYRFANLPPGIYAITVRAEGFATSKKEGLILATGHLPSIDFTLSVGKTETIVEVSGTAPAIDVTSNQTMSNVTEDILNQVPHGRSFQSVIQFAPSARNEPLQGATALSNGTGGGSPGNMSNGQQYGYSIGGAADSENSYLVEGQSTGNVQGGFSHTNVPADFIQEVQVKTSGIEAEHGGALGGVVNVVMKKGTNGYHGSAFVQFENDAMDGSPQAYSRYDPVSFGTQVTPGFFIDPTYNNYQPVKPKTADIFPGFTLGGPIKKDRIFFFVGFNPELNEEVRSVNYGPAAGGILHFGRNTQTYYTNSRVDIAVSQRVRLFASWLYQYQREAGELVGTAPRFFPFEDSTTGFFNTTSGCFSNSTCITGGIPPSAFSHAQGYAAPNQTTNVGADITLSPRLVSTTRFGYYFENYHDFGFPQGGNLYQWLTTSLCLPGATPGTPQCATDTFGNVLPSALQHPFGWFNTGFDFNFTVRDANKAVQFDQDIAWFKSGWKGTHNFKAGYQLHRLSNDLYQRLNEPLTNLFIGFTGATAYGFVSPTGQANCAPFIALYGQCQGQFGYINIQDFGSLGKATSFNHGLFVQDAWTIGHGVTVNAGVRFEKEYLPGEARPGTAPSRPINFDWTDKIAPRFGAAWDVFRDGRMKLFGSYGVVNDIMKLNLAISSFGGQYWQNCYYALDTANVTSIDPAFNNAIRYCVGPSASSTANFAGGTTPAGLTFLENQNFRLFPTTCSTCSLTQEGVAPGLKPYRQHESVFGVAYQLARSVALEARWDRRRLDHVIEDSSIFNQQLASETFVVVNPGQGVNSTFSGFCNFLYGSGAAAACTPPAGTPGPPNKTIPAARSYDGVELRLTKGTSQHWAGMFSYTYSHFRGNYTGLTSSDISDAGYAGRNSPNNSRSFDEPYFSWDSFGRSSSGILPTDRPNTFKGFGYYELGWLHRWTTDLGVFQYFYQGAPNTSFLDVGLGNINNFPGFPVDVVDRGKWVDVTQDPNTGLVTVGNPRTFRTPWYIQTDLNFQQNYKVSESKVVSFSATFANLFNQRSVTAVNESIDTDFAFQFAAPTNPACGGACSLLNGVAFYRAAMTPYNLSTVLNSANQQAAFGAPPGPVTINSQYGKPLYYQLARNFRLGVKFTF